MEHQQDHIKFCAHCGKAIHKDAVICVHCGRQVAPTQQQYNGYQQPYNPYPQSPVAADTPNVGITILGFFFPLIGLIMYLVWMNDKPQMAHCAGKGALIGFITSVCIGVVYGVIVGVTLGSMLTVLPSILFV